MISEQPEKTLPHRQPFLWVHRLIERDQETGLWGRVETDVRPDLALFEGHFPGNPVFPGVLQIEAAGQAAMWAHFGVLSESEKKPGVYFVGVESFKFRKPVIPPMTLSHYVKQAKKKAGLQLWEAEVTDSQSGDLVSKGSFWIKLI